MTKEQAYLISVIRSCLMGEKLDLPQELNAQEFFKLVKKQSLQVLVYVTLKRNNILLEGLNFLKKEAYKLIIKATELDKDSAKTLHLLKENNVKCVPIKGYNVKKLYPSADMRFSLDFDCLVDKKQLSSLKKVLTENNYKHYKTTEKHLEYLTEQSNLIEFHTKLFTRFLSDDFAKIVFEDYALNNEELSYETEYVISLAHLASHFISGGVGIRNIIDLYLLNNVIDRERVIPILKEINLQQFDNSFLALADIIFNNKTPSEFEQKLLDLIFDSNYLGGEKDKELYKVALNYSGDIKKAKRKSFWQKIYPSYDNMVGTYPFLRKQKWLLPIMYVVRHVTILFTRITHIGKLKQINDYEEEKVAHLNEILHGIGLDFLKE